jgi:DNA-binding transcriptional MocR family regulator
MSKRIPDGTDFAMIPKFIYQSCISPGACVVYLALAQYGNLEGKSWRSRETMALELGFSLKYVERALGELSKFGVIEIKRQYNRPSVYTVRVIATEMSLSLQPRKRRQSKRNPKTLSILETDLIATEVSLLNSDLIATNLTQKEGLIATDLSSNSDTPVVLTKALTKEKQLKDFQSQFGQSPELQSIGDMK